MKTVLSIPLLLVAAVLPAADTSGKSADTSGKPADASAQDTSVLPAGHYVCAASVTDYQGSYLDTRELSIARDGDAVTAQTERGVRLSGKIIGDRLYLVGSDIDDGGLQVISVVARLDGDVAAGDFVRSLDGRIVAQGRFLMRPAGQS
jgi:hypothetical protein